MRDGVLKTSSALPAARRARTNQTVLVLKVPWENRSPAGAVTLRMRIPPFRHRARGAGAGTVWVERELFSGRPTLSGILAERYPSLSAREQAFLMGRWRRSAGGSIRGSSRGAGADRPAVWDSSSASASSV